jgi:hypothetical protein
MLTPAPLTPYAAAAVLMMFSFLPPRYAASLLLRRLHACRYAAAVFRYFAYYATLYLCAIITPLIYADFRRHFAALRHAAIAADAAMILV